MLNILTIFLLVRWIQNLKTFSLKNFSAVLLRIVSFVSFVFAAEFYTTLHLNEKVVHSYFTSFERRGRVLKFIFIKKGFIRPCSRPRMQCRTGMKMNLKLENINDQSSHSCYTLYNPHLQFKILFFFLYLTYFWATRVWVPLFTH